METEQSWRQSSLGGKSQGSGGSTYVFSTPQTHHRLMAFFSRRTAAPSAHVETPEAHYFRGNRFYERKLWKRARDEWQQAFRLWHAPAREQGHSTHLIHLRVALAVICTVLLFQQGLLLLFPRDPAQLALLSGQQNGGNWWERLLNTGRPQPGGGHKLTVREWWEGFKRRMEGRGSREALAGHPLGSLSERWRELLVRHGRFGPMSNWGLDYTVISGSGLSRLGAYEKAVQVLEQGLSQALHPGQRAELYQGLANAHYYSGYHLQANGIARYELTKVKKAAQAYERSLRAQPRSLSYGNLGWMYFLLGDYSRSEHHSKKALASNANLHYVRLNLGLLYLVQGKHRRSFAAYYHIASRNLSDMIYLGGITDLREIVRDHPGNYPFAQLIIGMLSLSKGDLDTARRALARFRTGPSQGAYWDRIAERLIQNMQTSER